MVADDLETAVEKAKTAIEPVLAPSPLFLVSAGIALVGANVVERALREGAVFFRGKRQLECVDNFSR